MNHLLILPLIFLNFLLVGQIDTCSTTSGTFLYSEPYIRSKHVGFIPKNTSLILLSKNKGNFFKTEYQGKMGYIHYSVIVCNALTNIKFEPDKNKIYKIWVYNDVHRAPKSRIAEGYLYQLKDSSIIISPSLMAPSLLDIKNEIDIHLIQSIRVRRKSKGGRAAIVGAVTGGFGQGYSLLIF